MNDRASDSENLFQEIQKATKRKRHAPGSSIANHRLLPNYEILEEVHRGGQGVVFKAIQESTRRTVALKFILQGSFATQRQRFRFEREIDLASRLTHPNIVTIYDGGIANEQPFCAMEFVDGKPLNEFAFAKTNARATIRNAIEIFQIVCEAVGYAHSRGVIHRDLKPANILVDKDGTPHVLDFGLAKVLDEVETTGHFPRTMTGEFVGTLSYASPEQAQGNPELTDTRSDVYSLGVVLYELLTGTLPYNVHGSIVDTLNNITTVDPVSPTRYRAEIDTDVETILLKSLSKDPERRYQNATSLGNDLRHYLNGEPIDARRDSSWYVFRKTVVRHKNVALAAFSFVLLLIISLVAISVFYFQAIHDRDIATNAKIDEQKQREIAERETKAAETARQLEAAGREEAEFRTYVAHLAASDSSIRIYDVQDALRNLSNSPQKHRAFEWWYLLGRVDMSESSIGGAEATGDIPFTGDYRTVDYAPDGTWIAAGNTAGMLFFWNTGEKQIACQFDSGAPVQRLRVHPNGKQVAVGFSTGDSIILDVDSDSGELQSVSQASIRFSTDGKQLHALEYTPDGKYVLLACGNPPEPGCVYVYESNTGELFRKIEGHEDPVWCVAVSHDGRLIASADNEIRIWDFQTGELRTTLSGHDNWIWGLAFHPDSRQLASCALEQEVKIWDVPSGNYLMSLSGHTSFVNALEYSDDGMLLATASEDRTIRFWDTGNYAATAIKWGHIGGISDVAFNPLGNLATSGSLCVKTWNTQPESQSNIGTGYLHKILDIDIRPDSKRMLVCDHRGRLIEWSLTSRSARIISEIPEKEVAIRSVAYSPTKEYAAWASDDGNVYLYRFKDKQTKSLAGHLAAVNSVTFSSDGALLYSASDDKTVLQWDVESNLSSLFCKSMLPIKKLLISADGKWIATADEQGISILDVATREQMVSISRPLPDSAQNFEMAFSPDSTQIAAPLPQGFTGVWKVSDGSEVARLGEHVQLVQALAWSPDGKRIATASRDGTVKLWDSKRIQVVLTLRGFNGYCETIAFSPDNNRLIGGLYDGSIKFWNTLDPSKRRTIDSPSVRE